MKKAKATGIILAGGKATRMGQINKSFLHYEGKTFIEIALEKMQSFDEIVIVANEPELYETYNMKNDIKIIKDQVENLGPLCGIYSGMACAKNEVCVVIPVDSPFINSALLKEMVEIIKDNDAVIPKIGEYVEPLCGVYKKTAMKQMKKALDKKEMKVNALYKKLKVNYVKEEQLKAYGDTNKMFQNINTMSDYKALK